VFVRIDHRLRKFFEAEEHPCLSVRSMVIIWHIIASVLNRLATRPAVVRYGGRIHRRVLEGNFEPFVKALEVWLYGMKHSTRLGYSLREAVRAVLGRDDPMLRYYIRYLGMYMTRNDVMLFRKYIPSADTGFAYPTVKVIFTGDYTARHPFEFQVEVAMMSPCLYLTEDKTHICLDTAYLHELAVNLLLACSRLTRDYQTSRLLETIVDNAEVEGFEISFSHIGWGFEYRLDIRWCLIAVQKQNLYGSYPYYEYYLWIVREMYPGTEAEPIKLIEERKYAIAETEFVDVEKELRPIGKVAYSKLVLSKATTLVLEEAARAIAEFAQRRQEAVLRAI